MKKKTLRVAALTILLFLAPLCGKTQSIVYNNEGGPLDTIHSTPGFTAIFSSWGFIGDSLCSGESYIVVARDGEKEHFVYTLASDDGTPILTAYDCDVAYRNTQRGASFIIIIFLVLFILTGIFGILVGRNPESYPHWFRKLFYQDWAWISSRSAGYIKRRK